MWVCAMSWWQVRDLVRPSLGGERKGQISLIDEGNYLPWGLANPEKSVAFTARTKGS